MMRPWILASLACLPAGLGLAAAASAQVYRWTTDTGEVHISDGLESIPERFRPGALLLLRAEPPGRRAPAPAAPAASVPGGEREVLARVAFAPGVPIVVNARVNGGRSVQLILDTGADRTVIAPRALWALGVDMRPVRRGTMRGVSGTVEVESVMLDSLAVGEARTGPLEIVAHDPGLSRGEGLLGRDFLDQFVVNIDTRANEVLLVRR